MVSARFGLAGADRVKNVAAVAFTDELVNASAIFSVEIQSTIWNFQVISKNASHTSFDWSSKATKTIRHPEAGHSFRQPSSVGKDTAGEVAGNNRVRAG